MALKSYKPPGAGRATSNEDEEPRKRYRKMTVAQLEQRLRRRRQHTAGGKVTNVLKGLSRGITTLNQNMAQQAKKMPNDSEVNKQIWG